MTNRIIATLTALAAGATLAVSSAPAASAAWEICTSGQRLTPTQRAWCEAQADQGGTTAPTTTSTRQTAHKGLPCQAKARTVAQAKGVAPRTAAACRITSSRVLAR